jgi:glucosamine--fructose-6-phosphate aminotransferase (isomerizing)
MFKTIRELFNAVRPWRICVGRDIRRVNGPSLILFPLNTHVLFCGLAGILAVKGVGEKTAAAAKAVDAAGRLMTCFPAVAEYHLEAVLSGRAPAAGYLGGDEALAEMMGLIQLLKGSRPFERLFFNRSGVAKLYQLAAALDALIKREEKGLEAAADRFSTADLEIINARLIVLKDIAWGLEKDVLDNIDKIRKLAGGDAVSALTPEALDKYRELNFLLNCLDRLEVRGRDSAGIQLSFQLKDGKSFAAVAEGLKKDGLYDEFCERTRPSDLTSGSIHVAQAGDVRKNKAKADRTLSFTYKTSSIIGELGLNCRDLREAISQDRIFQTVAGLSTVFQTSLAHTRWASVGSITEENCHPVNSFTLGGNGPVKHYPSYGAGNWSINCVLNGDIDNYESLRRSLSAGEDAIAPELTTDTKIIPLEIEQHLVAGHDLAESFRLAVSAFEGSHAIAMTSNVEPGKAFLALRGSGQSIYIGLTPDRYIFSSELYGLVEGTPQFLKMDGEMPSPGSLSDTTGQIFILDQASAGGAEGIQALFYDGTALPVEDPDIRKAEMTTRDIDRGFYDHYFLKEVTEAAQSVRKTLRGKYRIVDSGDGRRRVTFNLGADVVPDAVKEAIVSGRIRRIFVIGHGTAAVAAGAIADTMARYLMGSTVKVASEIASELSGFSMKDDLTDTLIIPITQSGTTTDTNRAVAMAVERGASAIAVVNRRQSDITTKTQGVFYTSDGRDIEMSVASTKAFYSQIVAGNVLALFFTQLLKTASDDFIARELLELEKVPALMNQVLEKKADIRAAAKATAKEKKYWAIVGSGPNKIAADEIRIKLSELCYKTISSDVVENKKHIDLSAEPLIIVCAGGTKETVVGDIIKDTAIFKAHKASVVVFADEDEHRFDKIADAVSRLCPSSSTPWPAISGATTPPAPLTRMHGFSGSSGPASIWPSGSKAERITPSMTGSSTSIFDASSENLPSVSTPGGMRAPLRS